MLILPIGTDRRHRTRPWVNYAIIAANVVVFLLTRHRVLDPSDEGIRQYFLDPDHPQLYQFITYQFLHADWMHIIGNMAFLYVFGGNLEDRLGKVAYLGFYLAGGVLAALGHALVEPSPVLGASGAVAAVTGAYLVFFPRVQVTMFFWFIFYVDYFEISSLVLILFQIGTNVVYHFLGIGQVAYLAHLVGYAFGFGVAMVMLWVGLAPREPYDLLALLEHRRRRRQFARLTKGGMAPWMAQAPNVAGVSNASGGAELTPAQRQVLELRGQISRALREQNLGHAADLYGVLLEADAKAVLGQQEQLDVANALMSQGRYDQAAKAYELMLEVHGRYTQREQVELILGLIYARYVTDAARAKTLLSAALPKLTDIAQRKLAEQVLAEVA